MRSEDDVLTMLPEETIDGFMRRAAKAYPGEWIVCAGGHIRVVCHSPDEEVALQAYYTIEGSGIQPPDYDPPPRGIVRARTFG